MTLHPDGTLTLLPNETLPQCLVGKYIPIDKNRYRLNFPECPHHEKKIKVKSCGHRTQADHCKLREIFISPKICTKCISEGKNHEQTGSSPDNKETLGTGD